MNDFSCLGKNFLQRNQVPYILAVTALNVGSLNSAVWDLGMKVYE